MTAQLSATGGSQIEKLRLRTMLRALRNSKISVFYQTPDLNYCWAENIPDFWQITTQEALKNMQCLSAASAEKLHAAKTHLLASGEPQRLELALTEDNAHRWYEFFIDCDKDDSGTIIGIVTTAVEISELKRREQVLKILLREVSHRSKNLLAVIQSIAMQTARFSGSVEQFLQKFRGRLHSLSHSQDLVTDSNWHGASFTDLLHAQIEKYIQPDDPRLTITGENVFLFPNAALHLGLAFHELIVNSASYGALSHEEGQLSLTAELRPNDQAEMDLIIHWQELTPTSAIAPRHSPHNTGTTASIPAVSANSDATTSNFGSTVLQRIVPQAVNGRATYSLDMQHVDYRLTLPPENFDY